MPNKTPRRVEDVACSILNDQYIQKYQGVMKGIGGKIADVKSPGLMAQILIGSGTDPNGVCCENLQYDSQKCKRSGEECYILQRVKHFRFS